MSHYTIAGRDARLDISIGWDPPMQTFFASVRDPDIDEDGEVDPVIFCVGCTHCEVRGVQSLASQLRRYAEVPAQVAASLAADKTSNR